MVGASLARSLAPTAMRIAVVESVPQDSAMQPSYDDRVIALAWGSRVILEGMKRWAAIRPAAEPIRRIHVSDRGHFGCTRLDAQDSGVPALGYVVSARAIGRGLNEGLTSETDLDWLCPARVQDVRLLPDFALVGLDMAGERREVRTKLLVAADGGDSPIRSHLGIRAQQWRYGYTAVIANVTPGRPHQGVAFERFTDSGPMAMLPMTDDRCSLVWTQPDAAAPELLDLDDETFLARLQERFGFRLGRLRRVGRRAAYPLTLKRVKETTRHRLVLIGNAAHTLHPVAGQGFNLGLRDVAELAEVLAEARRAGEDPGSAAVLKRYATRRRTDQRRVALLTDVLARLFVNPLLPVRLGRSMGLLALDLTPPIKHVLTRQFMGLGGALPRLARGVPLVH
jgi:2-octaprenyl-6-methoxyphenol hydroxylase